MRNLLLAVTLLALAGCTSSPGGYPDAYLVDDEAVTGFTYMDPADAESQFEEKIFAAGNPGPLSDNFLSDIESVRPESAHASLLENEAGDFVMSMALRFASSDDLQRFLTEEGVCEDTDGLALTDGTVFAAAISFAGDARDELDAAYDGIKARTGATDAC